MDKRFLVVMAVIVVAFVGIFMFSSGKNSNGEIGELSNNVKGENSKNVELVAYEDFQCPACGSFDPLVNEIVKKYEKDIAFRFRHFPLDTIHPNARAASRTAEAAGKQGKFFEMKDLLYSRQSEWSESTSAKTLFDQYAQQLSLNQDQFNADFESASVNSTINADLKQGKDLGVNGTPTFFINGDKIETSEIQSLEAFSKKIDEYIAKSESN